jgi:SAM-dependent methyltransferase
VSTSGRSQGRRFDRDHGVATQAVLFLADLDPDVAGDAGAHATHYEPVPVAEFRHLLRSVPKDVIRTSTFVDVGAGLGRAVLLASEYPFKQIVGVEVSPALYEVAKDNVASVKGLEQQCRDIRLVRDDARLWKYPSGDVVVFLYNPFDAEAMAATLASIEGRDNPGATWIVYHTPVEREVIERDGRWAIVTDLPSGAVYEATRSPERLDPSASRC